MKTVLVRLPNKAKRKDYVKLSLIDMDNIINAVFLLDPDMYAPLSEEGLCIDSAQATCSNPGDITKL